jgi:serine/threonine protein kinase
MKTRKKKGGRYLGQGTYGCAFNPPLKCTASERKKNGISKLLNENSASEEYLVNQIWKEIDPNQKFSIWATNYCKFNSSNIKNENQIDKCTVSFKTPKKERLILYPYGGVDLYKYLYVNPPKAKDYLKIFTNFSNLLEGIKIANSNNIVHLDIKEDNIVVDNDLNMRFIDFGFSKIADEIDINVWDINKFKHASLHKPFELYFYDNNVTIEEIQKHYDGFSLLNNEGKPYFSYSSINELVKNYPYILSATGFIIIHDNKWINVSANDYYEDIKSYDFTNIDKLFKSVDIYSLGIVLISLINRVFKHSLIYDINKSKYIVYIIDTNDNNVDKSKVLYIQDDYKDMFSSPEVYELHVNIMKHITLPLLSLAARISYYNPSQRYFTNYLEDYKDIINSESFKKYMNPTLLHKALKDFNIFDSIDSNDINEPQENIDALPPKVNNPIEKKNPAKPVELSQNPPNQQKLPNQPKQPKQPNQPKLPKQPNQPNPYNRKLLRPLPPRRGIGGKSTRKNSNKK